MISFIPECFQAESIANSIREIQMNVGERSTEAASVSRDSNTGHLYNFIAWFSR
jgi:hypothetical protein